MHCIGVPKKVLKQVQAKRALRAKLTDALNRIDEFASEAVRDNDNGEAEQLAKDYSLVFDALQKI